MSNQRLPTCPCCGGQVTHDFPTGETAIFSSTRQTWVRITLPDEAIRGLASGMLRLEAVPTTPATPEPAGEAPSEAQGATPPELLRLAMSVALFEARDRMVALARELNVVPPADPIRFPLGRGHEVRG
jgi:hypothetical protein